LEFIIYDKGVIGSKLQGRAVLHSSDFAGQDDGFDGEIEMEIQPDARLHVMVVVGEDAYGDEDEDEDEDADENASASRAAPEEDEREDGSGKSLAGNSISAEDVKVALAELEKTEKPLHTFARYLRAKHALVEDAYSSIEPTRGPISKSVFIIALRGFGIKQSTAETIFSRLDANMGRGTLTSKEFNVLWRVGDPEDKPELFNLFHIAGPLLEEDCDEETMNETLNNVREAIRRGAVTTEWLGDGTPIRMAVKVNSADLVRDLVLHGADPNTESKQGVPVLHTATFSGNVEVINALANGRADVNSVDKRGQTPIFFAGTTAVCAALVKHGAHVDHINKHGQSCLHLAAKAGLTGVLRWLSKRTETQLLHIRDEFGASAEYYGRHAGVSTKALKDMKLYEPLKAPPPGSGRSALTNMNDSHNKTPRNGQELSQTRTNQLNFRAKFDKAATPWFTERSMPALTSDYEEDDCMEERRLAIMRGDADSHLYPRPASGDAHKASFGHHASMKGMKFTGDDQGGLLPQKVINQLSTNIRAVSGATHESSGDFLRRTLKEFSVVYYPEGTKVLTDNQLFNFIRKVLKVPKMNISDSQLHALCGVLARSDAPGSIRINDFINFVDPVYYKRLAFMNALVNKLQKADVSHEHVELIQAAVQTSTQKGRHAAGAQAVVPLDVLLRRLDNGRGSLGIKQCKDTIRVVFSVTQEMVPDDELNTILGAIRSGESDDIDILELVDLLDFERQAHMSSGEFERLRATKKGTTIERSTQADHVSKKMARINKLQMMTRASQGTTLGQGRHSVNRSGTVAIMAKGRRSQSRGSECESVVSVESRKSSVKSVADASDVIPAEDRFQASTKSKHETANPMGSEKKRLGTRHKPSIKFQVRTDQTLTPADAKALTVTVQQQAEKKKATGGVSVMASKFPLPRRFPKEAAPN
jgi:hypothetical protein